MNVSLDVKLILDDETPPCAVDAARGAVAREVNLDDLMLDVDTVEPLSSTLEAIADARLRGRVGSVDITVTLTGSTYDVQELVRRYEAGVK
jgi:hypothetical protein